MIESEPNDVFVTDEALITRLGDGDARALGTLHQRYAAIVFRIVSRALDASAAEDIVQEVFVAIWKNTERYDSQKGTVRAWLMQIAHRRMLNELRRRKRKPIDAADEALGTMPSDSEAPDEIAWGEYRRSVIRSALDALPGPQRQALSLAFFSDLTHEQIADSLNISLGTTKTRIRSGMQKLSLALTPLMAMLLAAFVWIIVRDRDRNRVLDRNQRALQLVTTSDTDIIRVPGVLGMPAEMHATYRGHAGLDLAVITLSHFTALAEGQTYQVWAHGTYGWRSIATARPDGQGHALLIAQDPQITTRPDGLMVTVESVGAHNAPSEHVVARWNAL